MNQLRYKIYFLEIGRDRNRGHVHFLVQSVPTYSVSKIITIIKSLTSCEIFRLHPEVKRQLWGGEFGIDGYYTNTVSQHGNEQIISLYVKNQGVEKEYKTLHKSVQLSFFEYNRYPIRLWWGSSFWSITTIIMINTMHMMHL